MPYLIKTSTPVVLNDRNLTRTTEVTRQAVATLEEAQAVCEQAAVDRSSPLLAIVVASLGENGGRVVMPDGTLITVEEIDDVELAVRLGHDSIDVRETDDQTTRLIDAYNAKQGATS